jgi:hypothetical protein
LALPNTDNPETQIINPQTNAASQTPGTIVYDSNLDCLRYFKGTAMGWSDCLKELPK